MDNTCSFTSALGKKVSIPQSVLDRSPDELMIKLVNNGVEQIVPFYGALSGTGPQGGNGQKGDKGDKGDQGDQGEKGEKGEKGENGLDGKDGKNGIDGEKGEKGEKGDAGEKGDKGDPGIDGKSITEEDIDKMMEKRVASWALDFERRASDILAKAITGITPPSDGEDGKDGKDGKEGGLTATYVDDTQSGHVFVVKQDAIFWLPFPFMIFSADFFFM